MLLLPKCAYDGSNSLSTFNMKICGLVTRIYEICVSTMESSRTEEIQEKGLSTIEMDLMVPGGKVVPADVKKR